MICTTPLPHTPTLNRSQVEFYRREGYLLPEDTVLPSADFRDLCSTFEVLQAEWIAMGGRPEAMNVPHFYHPEMMRWLMHPAILDLVEPIIGPDILMYSSHFICKPAGDGQRIPWHEDAAYWRKQWSPMDVVTVWLALDDSDADNGCMNVVPRTHLSPDSDYSELSERAVFTLEIKTGTFDASKAVPCIRRAGQASLHHGKTIHGSAPNTSSRRRCGFTMRYASAACRYFQEHGENGTFQVYQARGRNLAGSPLADPTKINKLWIDRFGYGPPKIY